MPTAKTSLLMIALVFCGLMMSGCGKASSPSEVTKAFFMDMNAGDYSKAQDRMSKDSKDFAAGDLFKAVADASTKNHSITTVDIVKEEIKDEAATVTVNIHYKDGTTQPDTIGLIRKDGEWKIGALQ